MPLISAGKRTVVAVLRERAHITTQLGLAYKDIKPTESQRIYAQSVADWDRVMNAEPAVSEDQACLANSLLNLATFLPHDQDEALLQRARELLEPAMEANPRNRNYRFELALCLDDYGWWLKRDGQYEEAEKLLRRAFDLRVELTNERPHDAHSLKYLARSYDHLSTLTRYSPERDETKGFWRNYLMTLEE